MPMQHLAYRKFRDRSILSHYASVADYLHYTIFDVPRKMNQSEAETVKKILFFAPNVPDSIQ
jgi:hypothetical protein